MNELQHLNQVLARDAFAFHKSMTTDPRPELTEDTELWSKVLTKAFAFDGREQSGLFAMLRELRSCGAQLVVKKDGWLFLRPGEMSLTQYNERYLSIRSELVRLFSKAKL